MSLLIVPNIAKVNTLANQLGILTAYPDRIHLFQNNATISATTIVSDLTAATFSGYAYITLSGRTLSVTLDAFSRAFCTWAAATWTKSGATGNTIYGYWVTDNSNNMMWVEKFDVPVPMSSDGAYLVITPRLTFTSQF